MLVPTCIGSIDKWSLGCPWRTQWQQFVNLFIWKKRTLEKSRSWFFDYSWVSLWMSDGLFSGKAVQLGFRGFVGCTARKKGRKRGKTGREWIWTKRMYSSQFLSLRDSIAYIAVISPFPLKFVVLSRLLPYNLPVIAAVIPTATHSHLCVCVFPHVSIPNEYPLPTQYCLINMQVERYSVEQTNISSPLSPCRGPVTAEYGGWMAITY